ncbi:MAG: glycosyltransferase family 2 protein [Phycisphaeraceae bacterium]|nr:glycosyltransferase family 2 protein [Phycisphaeraceae bacterium]
MTTMKRPAAAHDVLVGIPVFNEERYVDRVLTEVRRYASDILVIDDGSTDGTPQLLARHPVEVIRHARNRGYGRAMQDMLRWARCEGFEWLITMDCDEQHEPAAIPRFRAAMTQPGVDVISGSRYAAPDPADDLPPGDRRLINRTITDELNCRLGLGITDAFCGFKAYRVSACERLRLDVDGYDFPMQFWVEAVAARLRIVEIPVRLIYNDPSRAFGGPLNDAAIRLDHYRRTMHAAITRRMRDLPPRASAGIAARPGACGDGAGSVCAGV